MVVKTIGFTLKEFCESFNDKIVGMSNINTGQQSMITYNFLMNLYSPDVVLIEENGKFIVAFGKLLVASILKSDKKHVFLKISKQCSGQLLRVHIISELRKEEIENIINMYGSIYNEV